MIVAKHFEFEASHQLPDEPCYGKCRNLHGHTYKLTVEIEGEVDPAKGWVCNFSDIKKVVETAVINKYDHKHLNLFFDIPTAENIAQKIFADISIATANELYSVRSITLYETSNSYVKIEV